MLGCYNSTFAATAWIRLANTINPEYPVINGYCTQEANAGERVSVTDEAGREL